MDTASGWVVVGIDNGGTSNNATVLDGSGRFLVDRLVEMPSLVTEGPEVAVEAMAKALDNVLDLTGIPLEAVRGVGLDTPGPASADGVISSKGATNFAQPAWRGFVGDAESIASLTGIERNLLPYWLTRFENHELSQVGSLRQAAKMVRALGEREDPLALRIFEQQAMAIGRLFTIAANYSDPDTYFLGGGVVETTPKFRQWFLAQVRRHTALREEQARVATLALVPDLDMAGARGAAIAALGALQAPVRARTSL